MSHPSGRRLAALAGVPLIIATLTGFGPVSVQAAGDGTTPALPSIAGLAGRVELGAALVALGLLIAAVTIVRLRIQARRRRSPTPPASRWTKVTDTWGVYSTATARRAEVRSRW
ncbi:MAG: hypothetical protein ACLQT7_03915 [Candidatus Dormibacteria bacterium]